MRGEPVEIQSGEHGLALERLEIGVVLAVHLGLEDLDAVEAHLAGHGDAVFDLDDGLVVEMPEGIGGNADRIARPGAGGRFRGREGSGGRGNGNAGQNGGGGRLKQKGTAIHGVSPK